MNTLRIALIAFALLGPTAARADRITSMTDLERCGYQGKLAQLIAGSVARGEPRERTHFVYGSEPTAEEVAFLEAARAAAYAWTDSHPIGADATDEQRRRYAADAAEDMVKACLRAAGEHRVEWRHQTTGSLDQKTRLCVELAGSQGTSMLESRASGMTQEQMRAKLSEGRANYPDWYVTLMGAWIDSLYTWQGSDDDWRVQAFHSCLKQSGGAHSSTLEHEPLWRLQRAASGQKLIEPRSHLEQWCLQTVMGDGRAIARGRWIDGKSKEEVLEMLDPESAPEFHVELVKVWISLAYTWPGEAADWLNHIYQRCATEAEQ